MIETAYRVELPTETWLEQVTAAACQVLGAERGGFSFHYDASRGDWIDVGALGLHRLSPGFARDFFDQPDMPREAILDMVRVFTSLRFGSIRDFMEQNSLVKFAGVFDRYGIPDMVGINGLDPSGRGCMVTVVAPRRAASARTRNLWYRLAAHVSAGNRLRTALAAAASLGGEFAPAAEAVLAANGTIEHATGSAAPRQAREALRDALIRIEKARSGSDDPERSVELWRGLVTGRWSLVEHFERDGRRYFLAHKNDPVVSSDRALSQREKQILRYAELGHSNKLIAYELGISASTVASLLARARSKLGTSDS